MGERTSEYWQERFRQMEESQHDTSVRTVQEIEQEFRRAEQALDGKINAWYQRFAADNGISMVEARRLLNSDELEEFRWDVQDYIKYGRENGINQQWAKQLENASAKVHISRLEALKVQTQQEIEKLYGNYHDSIDEHIANLYTSGYYHTAYEVQRGIGVGWQMQSFNPEKVNDIIHKPWAVDGRNFSERIWTDKTKLINNMQDSLTRMCITGESPDRAIREISQNMKVSRSQAARIVQTESAAFSAKAQETCFSDLDVEEFEVVETLDSHTCPTCGEMDGKHFSMKDYKIGVTVPPFHPNCRGCTCPYFNDEFTTGERVARGADGKKYYVPENTTYEEWKKSFVDGDKPDLKPVKKDDTVELKSKIADTDVQISDLKKQFSDTTDGYSYDEWFKDFKSIEEGYGETPNGDETFDKLKDLDKKVRNVSTKRSKLLKQKERRGQLDTGYKGKIPDDELDAFNKRALEQIKLDTGYSDEKAKEFQDALKEYFGGDYGAILSGETQTAKVIRDGLDLMPVYDGGISRGMTLNNSDVAMFSNLKIGDELPQRGIIESWTSENGTAIGYSGISDYERSSVILECENNETAVGVQHLSLFGTDESEVLSSSKYEVVEMITENKYDYLSKHKEYLYLPEDLEDEKAVLKENVVCIIKVKEKS